MKLRHLLLLALVLTAGLPLPAQTVTPLRQAGPRANRINLVFVGDGYTAAESAKLNTDATAKLDMLLGNEAWSRFADQINADAIFVASAQSGADDPATGTVRDTYFNSTFGHHGIDRLIGIDAQGNSRLLALLAEQTPDYDVVILLVNAAKYGGSGGFPIISSLSPDSDEIVLHELGHSFAALTDEYVDPASAPFYLPAEYPNATQQSDPAQISWRLFIQPTTAIPTSSAPSEDIVGLFPGSHYRATGFYRPTADSKMRTLGRPFGPVNLRAFANGLHRFDLNGALTPPVITQQPAGAVVSPGQSFSLTVTASGTGPFTYQWRLNSLYVVNATAPTLTVASTGPAHAGVYAVEVTNAFGTVTSTDATVSLAAPSPAPPSNVRIQPASFAITVGNPVTFTATADGSPAPTFQWQKNGLNLTNGGNISGATSPTLALGSVTSSDSGNYTVVASNALGQSTSNPATLMVMVPVSPPTGASVTIQAGD
jgi:hypothetical protein